MSVELKLKTIEGDWDRFYAEFPDIYDRFALSSPSLVGILSELFDLKDKVILDIASGTGRSTFDLAKHARFVIGLEPCAPMRELAVKKSQSLNIRNVVFLKGSAEALPFEEDSADLLVSMFGFPFTWWHPEWGGQPLAREFMARANRIVRPGGTIIVAGLSDPCGGHEFMESLGFAHQNVSLDADFGSVQEAVETYGFICGQAAIDNLIANNRSVIHWNLRIWSLLVQK